MKLSTVKASFGLVSKAIFTGFNTYGTTFIGNDTRTVSVRPGDIAHSLRAVVFTGSAILNVATGSAATSTLFVAGSAQAITITAAGAVVGVGTFNIPVTVTATGMVTQIVNVPVKGGDTTLVWSQKARAALTANAVINPLFIVGGSLSVITLTRKPVFSTEDNEFKGHSAPLAALTCSIAAGTAAVTLANSTVLAAGAATTGVKLFGGSGKDFEGITLPALVNLDALMIESVILGVSLSQVADPAGLADRPSAGSGVSLHHFKTPVAIAALDLVTFAALGTGYADIKITLAGRSLGV